MTVLAPGKYRRFHRIAHIWLAIAIGWLVLTVVASAGADLLAPHAIDTIDLRARLAPPVLFGGTWTHPLGTDHLGRDMLSRLLFGLRLTLLIALAGTVIGAVVGTTVGLLAAHLRGAFEAVTVALIDAQAALPFLIVALGALALLGNSLMLFFIIVGMQGWERYARLARGLAMSAERDGYADALRHVGAGPWRIYVRHILPNIAGALVVNLTLGFPETILLESALSFVGLGVQPPNASLGSLLGYGRDYLLNAWWLSVPPGFLIFFTALSVAIAGDAVRDRLDPATRDN